jgi:L-lactate dehydrogenase complex protein LldG
MSLSSVAKLAEFTSVLKELKGEEHFANTHEELISILRNTISANNCRSVVLGDLPEELNDIIMKALPEFDCRSVGAMHWSEAVKICERADIGVTWSDFAIASQGALVEVAYDDSTKLASSLPFVHVALLPSSHVLENLSEAMLKVKDIIASRSQGRIPVISLISGPSKTSDIELRLLYGVHGPNSLHVVILTWL